jgi:hypothetical protein
MTTLKALREAAEKATPGEWIIAHDKGEFNNAYWIGTERHHTFCQVENGADDEEYGGPEREKANATYIALANPATMLALLDLIEAQHGALVAWKSIDESEGLRSDWPFTVSDTDKAIAQYNALNKKPEREAP